MDLEHFRKETLSIRQQKYNTISVQSTTSVQQKTKKTFVYMNVCVYVMCIYLNICTYITHLLSVIVYV